MADYETMYHHLVARVDDALQYLAYDVNDSRRVIQTAEMLREALLDAEEEYITEDSL